MSQPLKDIDALIVQLTSLNGAKCQLDEDMIKSLCLNARELLMKQPMLLELKAPMNICGDVHGQFEDLMRIFKECGVPPEQNYLFLGDYVDRGAQSLETICLLLAYKLKYPNSVHLIRGNHECASINKIYGFYDEVKRRHNVKIFQYFVDCFNVMPVAAIISKRIFCCHGGLSPELKSMQQIRDLKRPLDVPETGLMCDLLWADVNRKGLGWGKNERGVSVTYSQEIVRKFLDKNDFDLMVRAHEVVEDGYEFFGHRKLITIFSAPNYCGQMNNAGAVLHVNNNLTCSLTILKPRQLVEEVMSVPKVLYYSKMNLRSSEQ